jgi:hypothetical protein
MNEAERKQVMADAYIGDVRDEPSEQSAKAILGEVAKHLAESQSTTPYIPQNLQQQVMAMYGLAEPPPGDAPALASEPAREASSSDPLD